MKFLLSLILILYFTFSSFAQAGPDSRLEELREERDDLKIELLAVQQKLQSNRGFKGVGIGLTIVGALVFWPAIIPGLPMWIAAPTKKWKRKEEKI